MKIGVWLNNNMMPQEGGAYTYIHALVKLLDVENFEGVEIEFLTYAKLKTEHSLQKPVIYLNSYFSPFTFFLKLSRKLFSKKSTLYRLLTHQIDKAALKILKAKSIDYVYYLNQAEKEIKLAPFIATNWDIAHLSLKEFPEFTDKGQLEKREKWYNEEIKKASLIAVESEAGKNEMLKFLKIPDEKIAVIPFFVNQSKKDLSSVAVNNLLSKLNISTNEYFYYPAQYWKHKNHSTLLKGFAQYSKTHSKKLVFSGADKGELDNIKQEIGALKLSEKVICLNFVSEQEKEILLQNCFCLVMPSFLGPTNLPPLEALEYDIHCICSNLAGHIEMLENCALYFNPNSTEEILVALTKITDEKVRAALDKNRVYLKTKSAFTYHNAKNAIQKMFMTLKTTSTP